MTTAVQAARPAVLVTRDPGEPAGSWVIRLASAYTAVRPGALARLAQASAADDRARSSGRPEQQPPEQEHIVTVPPITDDQVRALRDDAGRAGDLEQVMVCDRALAGSAQARRECAEVIAYAQMRAAENKPIAAARYQDETGWHRKHDMYGGPHDDPPSEIERWLRHDR
jgi:hypothetical protein